VPMGSVYAPASYNALQTAALAYDPANPGANGDIRTWDVTAVTNFQYMLKDAAFNADVGAWDTSRVVMMKQCFEGSSAFNQDLSQWDVSRNTDMFTMFQGCSAFNSNLNSWDVSAVTRMDNAFGNCEAFDQDISSWNIASVTSMTNMFLGASALSPCNKYLIGKSFELQKPSLWPYTTWSDESGSASAALCYPSPSAPPPAPLPRLPPHTIPAYQYWDQFIYGTSTTVLLAAASTQVVTSSSSTFVPSGHAGPAPTRDAALDGLLSVAQLHRVAATQYASFSLPVWQVKASAEAGGHLIYLFDWQSSGVLSADATGWSTGVLNDPRVFSETIPWTNNPTASIAGDPHMRGAYGGSADFKGIDGGVYSLLSARNVSVNAQFRHRTFTTPFSRLTVHGSFVTAAFVTLRGLSSVTHHVGYHVETPGEARVYSGASARQFGEREALREGSTRVLDGCRMRLAHSVLTIRHPFWRVEIQATSGSPHLGVRRLNVNIQPVYAIDDDAVAPHGLLGQTFDRSHCRAVNGRTDDYSKHPKGVVRTSAAAEGAIEGRAEDYLVYHPSSHLGAWGASGLSAGAGALPHSPRSPFSTAFNFSRFDASEAPPRDAARLAGERCRRGPQWNATGGPANLVTGLNFEGHDLEN